MAHLLPPCGGVAATDSVAATNRYGVCNASIASSKNNREEASHREDSKEEASSRNSKEVSRKEEASRRDSKENFWQRIIW